MIFLRRDLDEVIASQNVLLDARAETRGADDDRMRRHYGSHLAQLECFLARRRGFTTLMVPCAEVVASPHAEAARINAFLGGQLDGARMAAVAETSLCRNRRSAGPG